MTSPYQCTRHCIWWLQLSIPLVPRVLLVPIWHGRTPILAKKIVRYFACPVKNCTFKKPDKWQHRRRYEK